MAHSPRINSTSFRDPEVSPPIEDEDLEEFLDAFSCFKITEDGIDVMDTNRFPHFMRALGQCPTEAEMVQMLREVGALETERVTFDQIVEILKRHFQSPYTEEELKKAFQVFDSSGDGTLGTSEIMFVINNLGEVYQEDEVREMFVEVDKDRDGRIKADDFIGLMGDPEMRTRPGTNKSSYKMK